MAFSFSLCSVYIVKVSVIVGRKLLAGSGVSRLFIDCGGPNGALPINYSILVFLTLLSLYFRVFLTLYSITFLQLMLLSKATYNKCF